MRQHQAAVDLAPPGARFLPVFEHPVSNRLFLGVLERLVLRHVEHLRPQVFVEAGYRLRNDVAEPKLPKHEQVLHGVEAAVGDHDRILKAVLVLELRHRGLHGRFLCGIAGVHPHVDRVGVAVDHQRDRNDGQVGAMLFGGASHPEKTLVCQCIDEGLR